MEPTTIELRNQWIGDRLEEGRIGFTNRQIALVKQGHLDNGMGWSSWDDTRLVGLMSASGTRYSPLAYMLVYLLSLLSDNRKRWFWLWGDKGIGKTHLATIAGVLWIARTSRAAYLVNWADWISKMQRRIGLESSYQPIPDEMQDAHIQTLVDVPFLVLDDVSTGHTVTTLWSLDQLYVLLNERIGKPTVITSNLSTEQYTKMLLNPPAKVNGDRATYVDVAEKIADRLGSGPGGNLFKEWRLHGRMGSYRQGDAE